MARLHRKGRKTTLNYVSAIANDFIRVKCVAQDDGLVERRNEYGELSQFKLKDHLNEEE